ncbi:MAG: hypothetical protein J6U05_04350 [Neisseriaceae bacterium]|nr:hypothetical protein [Neisseriaceae bacterium]
MENSLTVKLGDFKCHPCPCTTVTYVALDSVTHPTTQTEPPTVIASEHSERGNLPAMENAPNLHSDKKIATTATQSRNDSNDFSGCLKPKFNPVCHCEPEQSSGVAIQFCRQAKQTP